jgi:hypothetical protein
MSFQLIWKMEKKKKKKLINYLKNKIKIVLPSNKLSFEFITKSNHSYLEEFQPHRRIFGVKKQQHVVHLCSI